MTGTESDGEEAIPKGVVEVALLTEAEHHLTLAKQSQH
jgi:hypothetical protein